MSAIPIGAMETRQTLRLLFLWLIVFGTIAIFASLLHWL